MKPIDRLILTVLAAGIWTAVLLTVFEVPAALAVDTSDIDGLRSYIESVIEDCTVDGTSISC
ncbi:MAG TPA: hypothetical protein VMW24_14250 [Sedimentisphaerales bacterium]|nr:hypothetical protein [Sedimentisphaerales bacterium]